MSINRDYEYCVYMKSWDLFIGIFWNKDKNWSWNNIRYCNLGNKS